MHYNLLREKKQMLAKSQAIVITTPEVEEDCCTPESCFGNLFSFRDEIHLHHLKTQSYAQHKALNKLYESVLDIIDTLIETYQADGLVDIVIPETKICCEPLEAVTNFMEYVQEMRMVFTKSYQQQILDNLDEILRKTTYKLKFLK